MKGSSCPEEEKRSSCNEQEDSKAKSFKESKQNRSAWIKAEWKLYESVDVSNSLDSLTRAEEERFKASLEQKCNEDEEAFEGCNDRDWDEASKG